MTIPDPRPGLVVRYDYLWSHEVSARHDAGKDRPSCIVAAIENAINHRFVVLLPITHRPPAGETIGIEIPARVKASLDLDEARSWIIVSEHNVDVWPNAGLSALPGRPGIYAFGFIPPGLFANIKTAFIDLVRSGKSKGTHR